jgi:hypothetical protein
MFQAAASALKWDPSLNLTPSALKHDLRLVHINFPGGCEVDVSRTRFRHERLAHGLKGRV